MKTTKIWKTAGCLVLLCAIICGCVVMGRHVDVSADTGKEPVQDGTIPPTDGAGDGGEQNPSQPTQGGSSVVEKTYSTGLKFRSNGDGTCALAGLGTCTAACVLIPPKSPAGDTVVSILPGVFADSIVGAVEIPAGVTDLSAESFRDCRRLSYVRVAEGNQVFSEQDGALYTADGLTLIYCPAGRGGDTLSLSHTVRRIAAGAFAECTTLKTVIFAGSSSEWHSVIIGDDNNALYAAEIRFLEANAT